MSQVKPKQWQWPITTSENNTTIQWEFKANTHNRRQARENACDQVVIGFASDWLRRWREFFKPITERSKAKPKQFRITFESQLKTALRYWRMIQSCTATFRIVWKLFFFVTTFFVLCFSDVRSSIVGWSERFDVAQKLLSLLNSYTPKEVRQSCLGMSCFLISLLILSRQARFYQLYELQFSPLLTLSLPRVLSSKLTGKSWISFCKIVKNKQYHMKVLCDSFHLITH